MGSLFVLLVLIIVVLVLVSLLKGQQTGPAKEMTYETRNALFSPAERSFLGVLDQAVAGQYRVFGKVRLGDLIQPAKGYTKGQRTGARNRINQKHVDFVLCQPDTLAPVGAVELDDSSHQRKDRSERDDFVDRALESAGIPVLRFAARKGYAVAEVQAQLEATLSSEEDGKELETFSLAGPTGESPLNVAIDAEDERGERETVASPETETEPASSEMLCSACNSPMVKRLAKKGSNAGKWFWACSAFPKCRKVVGIK
jgi:very-short-patch-repair endonuclease